MVSKAMNSWWSQRRSGKKKWNLQQNGKKDEHRIMNWNSVSWSNFEKYVEPISCVEATPSPLSERHCEAISPAPESIYD